MTAAGLVVDAHHHLWDPATADYPWLTEELAAIRRRFDPDDLSPLLQATGVDATVLVQTRSSVEETEAFLATAAVTPFIAGVVGWLELADPAIDEAIGRLRERSGGARLVAIRHQVQDEPDPDWLARPDVRRGIAAVGRAGLAYDLLVRTRELPAAVSAVGDLPGVRFVLDHLAKPPIRDGTPALEAWAAELRPLARFPNVAAKVSGLVTEANWRSWTVDDLVGPVRIAVDSFGPERLMFGSDWPVSLLAARYDEVLAAADSALAAAGVTADERSGIFGPNAVRIYRLAV